MPAKNNLRAQVTHKMFETVKQKKPQDALALLKADHQHQHLIGDIAQDVAHGDPKVLS